ncbi:MULTISPECIES: glutathione peroxidase [Paenibacillus]|uniref:glutathione peroxidase n=1 Tax=Paenibacillus TaxID=44249 RepID=UPI000F6E5A8A|nr:glutathione peroxidase [Paenibacillus sp. M-152]AZH31550.1 glutathione peroxidase [Paenibacillus sp. M-152]MCV9949909.1 glutathione peroxidase [Paenibacillus sp. BT-177]
MSVYSYNAVTPANQEVSLETYTGKVLVIANTASKCGLTPQYGDLQKLYDEYKDRGLVVLGFPCNQFGGQEPGSSEEAAEFCQLNYGVNFPVFAKVDVNGPDTAALFEYLKKQQPGEQEDGTIQWNFTKFIVNREGVPVGRFEPKESPEAMKAAIEQLL